MARLLVFRGDFVEQEIELGGGPIRIGRAPECDIVLEDPERSVSRAHAEVRYEDGAYLIADLGSQNGIFQYGARVDRAYLEAQNPITLGPFRLVIDETDASSGETSKLRQPPASPPPPRVSSRRGRVSDDYSDEDGEDRLDDSRGLSRAGGTSWVRSHAKTLWLGGAAVILAGGFGVAQLLSPSGPSDEERLIAHLSGARALLEQLEPQRAITEHIDPALAIDPNSVDANDLKVRAQELAERMAAGARAPESAPAAVTPVEGRGPGGRIPGLPPAAAPPPAAVAPGQPARPRPPDAPADRPADAHYRAQIDEAKQLRDRGQFLAAERLLDMVIRDAGAGFADAKVTLDNIRQRRLQEGQRLFREATDDAANERWEDAVTKFTRAHEIDPTLVVANQLEEIRRKREDAGSAKFKDAEIARKFGSNAEAIRLYEQVLRILPASHPLAIESDKRIKELKR